MDANAYVGNRNQGLAAFFATLNAALRFFILASFSWLCIDGANYLFSNTLLRVVCVVIFLGVGGRFVLPWAALLLTPISIIIGTALVAVTPKRGGIDVTEIRYCKNCRYYRHSPEYENIIDGLWRAESLPPLNALPCKIVEKSVPVWEEYFEMTMNSRAMFPRMCPLFEET